ncbi:phenylacetate--CoA ligase [Clostridium thermosuccinogenes]|uniref:Phenylacetate-coenzyme A ligase n=1 Tax=Clostridium thermosuccinogenes TaxID=84032 RepID=A0A2K2FAQ5_9CLOT|nr:phenylacetate--CoA ligase [Pseudoclostridium thermosuccinogenes]AUS96266.1 phenylacetate--CoA ligase [Pseudoclostridium thermosuccinogenes]PNT95090.1 phenylacetate--CoA ligase [Pseudoclostridium thermosuccinogenes]PNT95837.1 phenylacetate--CoA ligase [Pseudoclostridium thermosuccinogenes]
MQCWNPTYECMSREEREKVQTERLIETVKRVYHNVPFYRDKMQKAGLEPCDIKSLDDLKKLPFTYKQDLRDNYPYGLFAVPMSEIVRIHASSGTTGKQTVVGYTRRDLDTWAEVMARTLVNAGADKDSIVQVAYGYGLFTGGFGVHYGVERVGATVIPVSGGNTKRQLQIMKDFGTTILACTPSYALYLAEEMEEIGLKKEDLKLKSGIFGAEPWSERMRAEIEERFGITAIDIYGLSEVIGPGVASECTCRCGLHIQEDHFIPEIIDPDTEEVLPPGSTGELVFSTITKEGLPLLRYRTRDISSLNYEKCECGRTTVRMKKVSARSDDMLIIRGVNVFPSQIEEVLFNMGETAPHYLLIVDRVNNLDTLEVRVEMSQSMFSDEVKRIEDIERKLHKDIETTLGISARVKLVEPKSIERSEGKAKRIIDKRKI